MINILYFFFFFSSYSGARSRPRRRSLLFGEPRGALGSRGTSGVPEMRGSAKLACQVLVEDRRTAARPEPAEASGRGRSIYHQGQSNLGQRELRLRGHTRGDRLFDRELPRQNRRSM